MECSTTRNRYSVHRSRAIRIPPINPYMRTWRFISCRKIRNRNYRTIGGVGPTAGQDQRLTGLARVTSNREVNRDGKPAYRRNEKAVTYGNVSLLSWR